MPGLDKGRDNIPYLDMVGNVSGSLRKMTLAELQTYSTVGVYMELDAHLRSEDTHLLAARKLIVEDKELAAKAKKRRKKAEEPRDEEIARHFTEAAGYRGLVDQNKKFIHFVIRQCA